MTSPVRLIGSSVVVDDVREEDLDQLYDWFLESDPQRLTCRPIEPMTPTEIHARFQQRRDDHRSCTLAIRRCTDFALMGRVTYFDYNPRNHTVEIGFMTGPPYRRQGYTAEAVRLVLAYLFADAGIKKVMAQTGAFNDASISLLHKLGFSEDGRLRRHHVFDGEYYDDVLFSLLADEFSLSGKRSNTDE